MKDLNVPSTFIHVPSDSRLRLVSCSTFVIQNRPLEVVLRGLMLPDQPENNHGQGTDENKVQH